MKFYSTKNRSHRVSFQDAIFDSLPPDNGLYYPERIPTLDSHFLAELKSRPKEEVGIEIARHFVDSEIPESNLRDIVDDTINFDFPLIPISENINSLELFHGPTWAFKDLGARFLSRCMRHFLSKGEKSITILVATSGDTGGAVAAGFHGIEGVDVTILYPKGKVSELQQKQLTTWGDNISALEVDGTFDDCQRLVKTAFLDKEISDKRSLSSANSINIARLIPQMFYYFFAFQQIDTWDNVVLSVPSGNYGNLTAGLFAKKMGLPIKRFIAASNTNRVVPHYLESGNYVPKPSIETYANAMDVGAPSNFVRMLEYFEGDLEKMRSLISGFSLSNEDILKTMNSCYRSTGYVLDPHGAIGFQALNQDLHKKEIGIFLETAHPVKFMDIVERAISTPPSFESKMEELDNKKSAYQSISDQYEDFKTYLLSEED